MICTQKTKLCLFESNHQKVYQIYLQYNTDKRCNFNNMNRSPYRLGGVTPTIVTNPSTNHRYLTAQTFINYFVDREQKSKKKHKHTTEFPHVFAHACALQPSRRDCKRFENGYDLYTLKNVFLLIFLHNESLQQTKQHTDTRDAL